MPLSRLSRWLLASLILLNASLLTACLWDSDTRSMEEQSFPDALELITGGFLRHSPEFYEWRIADRLQKIEKEPNQLNLYDDLAVAYEKTGQTGKAIEVMEEIEARDPDRYETLANLGTFYIHHGELERGIEYIDKALEVNPDAHFGRERYQKYVVKYVLSKETDGETTLPLDSENDRYSQRSAVGFAKFLLTDLDLMPVGAKGRIRDQLKQQHDAEVKKAIKGVLGMMRFGNHDSPILLECLGDLLVHGEEWDSNLHLAARAYLKASYAGDDLETQSSYRSMASHAASGVLSPRDHDPVMLEELEQRFQEELEFANEWVERVFENERKWVAEGLDVEQKYAEVYYDDPEPVADEEEAYAGDVSYGPQERRAGEKALLWLGGFVVFGVFVGLTCIIVFIVYLLRRREAKRTERSGSVGPRKI